MTELVRYVQRLNAWRNPSVAEREEYPLYPLPWQEVSLTDLRQSPDNEYKEPDENCTYSPSSPLDLSSLLLGRLASCRTLVQTLTGGFLSVRSLPSTHRLRGSRASHTVRVLFTTIEKQEEGLPPLMTSILRS